MLSIVTWKLTEAFQRINNIYGVPSYFNLAQWLESREPIHLLPINFSTLTWDTK